MLSTTQKASRFKATDKVDGTHGTSDRQTGRLL